MTWRLRIETIEAKAFRIFIKIYSLLRNARLSAHIKFTLYKVLIRSVMTYAYPARDFAAETRLLKMQCLQNRVFRIIGNFPRRTSVRDMQEAFQIPYVYDYIIKYIN
jgi:hypothetical protein